jgi:hypothetical protein
MHQKSAAQPFGDSVGAGALDGVHIRTMRLRRRDEAGADLCAVDEHGAGAAIAGVAADLGAGESEPVAQHVGERLERTRLHAPRFPVDDQGKGDRRGGGRRLVHRHAALRSRQSANPARRSRMSASAAARR